MVSWADIMKSVHTTRQIGKHVIGVRVHPRTYFDITSDSRSWVHLETDIKLGIQKLCGIPLEITNKVETYEVVPQPEPEWIDISSLDHRAHGETVLMDRHTGYKKIVKR